MFRRFESRTELPQSDLPLVLCAEKKCFVLRENRMAFALFPATSRARV